MSEAIASLLKLLTDGRSLAQGVEGQLLKRQRIGAGGVAMALLGLLLGIASLLADGKALAALADLRTTLEQMLTGKPPVPASTWVFVGAVALMAFGTGLYVLVRYTRFLQAESREPFRYTVSIDAFERTAKDAPSFALQDESRMALIRDDLRERLNSRIGRFSLLDAPPAGEAAGTLPHIHVSGTYSLRKDSSDHWQLQVMPTVRLGSASMPISMAYTVVFDLGLEGGAGKLPAALTPQRYEQVVERVYASVAREIYRVIEGDVRVKIARFPTAYLRAVALFFEARDLARSNTVDAYDLALSLYRDAGTAFDMAPLRDARRLLVNVPLFWRGTTHRLEMRARMQTGHVQSRLYRYMIALQTGRLPNPIFDCVDRMKQVISDMNQVHARMIEADGFHPDPVAATRGFYRYPPDRFARRVLRRPLEAQFAQTRRVLYEAHVICALAYALLEAPGEARRELATAEAVDPPSPVRDPVYLVTKAEVEDELAARMRLLRSAVDLAPKFQIAQFRLAMAMELKFREEGELKAPRLKIVTEQYEEVLRINPGNLAAIASLGHLSWLMGQVDEAERRFREGLDFRVIVPDMATAELNYGLARIHAERGDWDMAYDQYLQAVASERGVAAWTTSGHWRQLNGNYYSFIDTAVIERYTRWCLKIVRDLGAPHRLSDVGKTIRAFAYNDLANALLNGRIRTGDPSMLIHARRSLKRAIEANPTNSVAHFNLSWVADLESTDEETFDASREAIDEAVKLAPDWMAARSRAADLFLAPWVLASQGRSAERAREELEALRRDQLGADSAAKAVQTATYPRSGSAATTGAVVAAKDVADKRRKLEERLRRQERQLETSVRSYEALHASTIAELTRTSALQALVRPTSQDAQQWCDNTLDLMRDPRMRLDFFDEDDVAALRSLAKATARRSLFRLQESKKKEEAEAPETAAMRGELEGALRRNQELILLLNERFHGGDFEMMQVSEIISLELGDGSGPARGFLNEAIFTWSKLDPSNHRLLSEWVRGTLERREMVVLAERLCRSRLRDPRRLALMADLLLEAPESAASDEHDTEARRVVVAIALARVCVEVEPADRRQRYLLARALGRPEADDREWDEAIAAIREALRETDDKARRVYLAWLQQGTRHRASEHGDKGDLEGAFRTIETGFELGLRDAGLARQWGELVESVTDRDAAVVLAVRGLALLQRFDAGAEIGGPRSVLQAMVDYEHVHARSAHVVVPIGVQVEADLLPLVATENDALHPDVALDVETLRRSIFDAHGVQIPGIRFYGGDTDGGGYVLMLDEVGRIAGSTVSGAVFHVRHPGSPAAAGGLGGIDPLSGRPGDWLPRGHPAPPGGSAEVFGPMQIVVRHLHALLRRHLADFLGHTELQNLLVEAGIETEIPERGMLLAALRGLLEEGASIVALDAIVAAWPEALSAAAGSATRAAEALRKVPRVRAGLPGNDGAHRLWRVGPHLAAIVEAGLAGAPEPVLTLEPALARRVSAALEEAVRPAPGQAPPALVTDSPALRPHVARLIQAVAPGLPVLCDDELTVGAAAAPPAATFDVEAHA